MGLRPADKQAALAAQYAAAHDESPQVLVIAGPGTGKSSSIEERVRWLLAGGVDPKGIHVISFTRASVRDLEDRVRPYCTSQGIDASDVPISTLHSLALRLLRRAGFLEGYPALPMVLDDWETSHIIDLEFAAVIDETPGRASDIRRHYEAMANTDRRDPVNFVPPVPPVTEAEEERFAAFVNQRRALYAVVLPGEMVRECLAQIRAGLLSAVDLLGIRHLVVDEYQDLNPVDLAFIDELIRTGVVTFVAGDDDQSIYSFRFASPAGIQDFPQRHDQTGRHSLEACFRCTPRVLETALGLMRRWSAPGRIAKNHHSLHQHAEPAVPGIVHRVQYPSDRTEAIATAHSCKALMQAGVPAREILVLLANQRVQSRLLYEAFETEGVAFVPARDESFLDQDAGRLAVSLLRAVCHRDDLVAQRVIYGLTRGIGAKTCVQLAQQALENNVTAQQAFSGDFPPDTFVGRVASALTRVGEVVARVREWTPDDVLETRGEAIGDVLAAVLESGEAREIWDGEIADLPAGMTLAETRDVLWTANVEQRARQLAKVYERLGEELPQEALVPDAVQFMSIHGSKGLSAQVVLVPGLEEGILPNPRQQAVAGLTFEAARLLYVAITRTRVACIISLARRRTVYGRFGATTPSRFARDLGDPFLEPPGGLSQEGAELIADQCKLVLT